MKERHYAAIKIQAVYRLDGPSGALSFTSKYIMLVE